MYPMPKRLRLLRWLAGPFIVLGACIGFLSGGISEAGVALLIAALPGMYLVEIPFGRGPRLHGARAGLILVSGIAIAVIIWTHYASLPTWLMVAATLYAILTLPAAVFDLVLVLNPNSASGFTSIGCTEAGQPRPKHHAISSSRNRFDNSSPASGMPFSRSS